VVQKIIAMKKCSKCRKERALSEFYKKKQSKDGYDFWCKECWKTKRPKTDKTYSKKSLHFTGQQINVLMSNIRKRSNIKGLECTVSTEYISNLVDEFCSNNTYSWKPKDPFKPSIDRIDSSKGYIPDNVQICWLIENYCKNTFTNEQVIEFCKRKLESIHSV
jgi:hypothetical protein